MLNNSMLGGSVGIVSIEVGNANSFAVLRWSKSTNSYSGTMSDSRRSTKGGKSVNNRKWGRLAVKAWGPPAKYLSKPKPPQRPKETVRSADESLDSSARLEKCTKTDETEHARSKSPEIPESFRDCANDSTRDKWLKKYTNHGEFVWRNGRRYKYHGCQMRYDGVEIEKWWECAEGLQQRAMARQGCYMKEFHLEDGGPGETRYTRTDDQDRSDKYSNCQKSSAGHTYCGSYCRY